MNAMGSGSKLTAPPPGSVGEKPNLDVNPGDLEKILEYEEHARQEALEELQQRVVAVEQELDRVVREYNTIGAHLDVLRERRDMLSHAYTVMVQGSGAVADRIGDIMRSLPAPVPVPASMAGNGSIRRAN